MKIIKTKKEQKDKSYWNKKGKKITRWNYRNEKGKKIKKLNPFKPRFEEDGKPDEQ